MILILLLSLFILAFVRSTKAIATLLAILFIAYSVIIGLREEDPRLWMGLGLATLLSLFVTMFIGRIPDAIDRLRIKKG